MDYDKFKQFLIINQINIKKNSITCGKCNMWLAPPIVVKNRVNYCGECTPKKGERNDALEDILNNYKYPCVTENCEYLEEYNEIGTHATVCKNVVTCTFCQTECDKAKIFEHLIAEHNAQVIGTDKLKFTITINTPLIVGSKHLVKVYNTQFLFNCAQKHEFIKCTLMSITNDVIDIDTYDIRMTTNMGKSSIHEGALQQFDATHSPKNEIEMYIGKADCCKLEISLGSLQQINAPECPICMYAIGSKLRQCVNGHNVCEDCGVKIDTCPMCREKIADHVVNIRHLYPNNKIMWPCRNHKNGCMAYFNNSVDQQHLDVCEFRSIKCCACPQSIRKCDLITHMQREHALKNNFDLVHSNLNLNNKMGNCIAYILFDLKVFKYHITSSGKNIEFKCDMAYRPSQCSHKYRFEFHIICDENETKALHIVNDVVGGNNECCTVAWQKFSQITSILLIRCCIFKETNFVADTCASDVDNKLSISNTPINNTIVVTLPRVFFDIMFNADLPLGRIIMELRNDIAPKTAENFRALCTHQNGYGYMGSEFFEINPNYYLQVREINNHDDASCGDRFDPENKFLDFYGPGTLVMCNTSISCSEFLITTSEEAPDWLNNPKYKFVVFGQVIEGLDVLKKMELCTVSQLCIINSGEL